jgi:hypothetical protein
MPEQNITLIAEQEASRLCPNDGDRRRKEYQRAILASLRAWERRRAEDPKAMHWELLAAYIARLEAEHHPSTEYFQDRMTWARGVACRLMERDGPSYVNGEPARRRIAGMFELPGFTSGTLL